MANPKVLIIGAGVTGLYTAWRLCIDGKDVTKLNPSDVVVVELSNRTNGRLFTRPLTEFGSEAYTLPKDSGLRAELGGMRFQNYHIYVDIWHGSSGCLTWISPPT